MFKINEEVTYTYFKSGVIEQVHMDDYPNLYYTLNLGHRQPQTTEKNFFLKNSNKDTFEKGDQVVYFKDYNATILDVLDDKYKIFYNDREKIVSEKRLQKLPH